MKLRFTTIDIRASVYELRQKLAGLRVVNVYDIDNKTYLIKFSKPDLKMMMLFESGSRIHGTEFDWPKNMIPSGFSMKLRKHLRGRRMESIAQVGYDRIIDMQFGSGPAAYHVILELYDRGNIVLTDFEYVILNLLRARTDGSQDVRFAVRETYPLHTARQQEPLIAEERLSAILNSAKEGDHLRKLLNPHLVYGPAVIDHCLLKSGFPENAKLGKDFNAEKDIPVLLEALQEAEQMLHLSATTSCKGYIVQKSEKKPQVEPGGQTTELLTYAEFHPFLFKQHENSIYKEFDTFDKAADDFFSNVGSQKMDVKALQQEKSALKKLENVKQDHIKRIHILQQAQESDVLKARLIEMNQLLVEEAIMVVQSALANQIDWNEIQRIVKEAEQRGDKVACAIKGLKLQTNSITMWLTDVDFDSDEDEDDRIKPMKVDIDLGLSAHSNATKYYGMKRHAAEKQQKTVDASAKALKSAERKTKQTLKDVQTVIGIHKARKTYWFEKFLWFISSENYMIIGGRDQQQNEIIVKKHLRPGDLYVHADLHGASSVIVKNTSGEAVPPKTLNEAGTMAICHSAAWDAKVVTSAWWVRHDQVSKTAPTGEYLTTGSFMIRGKKNYLPPSYLIYGFGFLFKLDDSCMAHHRNERRVRTAEGDDVQSIAAESVTSDVTSVSLDDEDDVDSGPDGEEGEEEGGEGEERPVEVDDPLAASAAVVTEPIEFPDTSIQFTHMTGNKYELHVKMEEAEADVLVTEVNESTEPKVKGPSRMSAKQRRDMKKKRLMSGTDEESKDGEDVGERMGERIEAGERDAEREAEREEEPEVMTEDIFDTDQIEQQVQDDDNEDDDKEETSPQCQQAPLKRRQKSKLKKIREKYKDQDEEERRLRMQILASAGSEKPVKTKKDKKNKQKIKQAAIKMQPQTQKPQQQQQQQQQRLRGPLSIDDIKVETLTVEDTGVEDDKSQVKSTETTDQLSDDEQDDKISTGEESAMLDSFTGLPIADDELIFCVAVSAPYSALLSYKYKVKLTPGSTKRGKAAKTALNTFTHDRQSTVREKDLFRSLKDVDISRNIPGKVKVSAPNLHKQKHK